MMNRTVKLFMTALACATFGSHAEALCLSGKLPLDQEFKQSRLVATAIVTHQSPIVARDDPEGIEAIRYDFATRTLFKGKRRKFSVWIDNTSSRMVFDPGVEYLVFVQQNGKRGFVDGCGNSGTTQDSVSTIEWLQGRQSH
ncbi:hypothetical protein GCM10027277_54890 [Pseudoduganella ginsengisoli]|uniref:Secreted protein n=1 Tax=Pseudoduganella ginsengisoli TaxID=1462440 RepID=A0A6L6Q679_9BURK|nr:hypothetical protein [Pseudoduganella ginsengisoli]MTW04924.1 hypothetical protein [Pseudoduganella ginsengisoli]